MKKVIGLFLVLVIGSGSVFAQGNKRRAMRGGEPAQRCEKIITELKLDEKQAADFRKVETEFREKMNAEREQASENRQKMHEKSVALRNEHKAAIKKILTEEQYKQYLEMQRRQAPRKGQGGRR